jgi:uridine phosphorylase
LDEDVNNSCLPIIQQSIKRRTGVQVNYPILEFDPSRRAIIEPKRIIKPANVPERCVVCFFQEAIDAAVKRKRAKIAGRLRSEIGFHPLYEIQWKGERIGIFHPGVGAAMASVFLEELIALGGRKFIACGSAGVLNREIALGHIIVPTAAVRDEGVSYHYFPPSYEINANRRAVTAIRRTLRAHGMDYIAGKTWTTDGLYRETIAKVRQRRTEGCLTVEMEAAAFFAVAKFRRVPFGQILYGGDDVSGADWDSRGFIHCTSVREKLFWLAAEACLSL